MEMPDSSRATLDHIRDTIAQVVKANKLQISADTIRKGVVYSDLAIRSIIYNIANTYYGITTDNSKDDYQKISSLILEQLVLQYFKPADIPYLEDGSVNIYAFSQYEYHHALRSAVEEAVIQAGLSTLDVTD
jgi:hypothetical protein